MRDLVKAGLARDVEVRLGWFRRRYRFLLPPPTVQEALEIITSRAGYVSGVEADVAVFRETLRRWVARAGSGRRHRQLLREIDYCLADYAVRLVFEGPKIKPRKRHPDEPVVPALWEETIAGYAAVFGTDPWQILTKTTWPFFLFMLKEAARIEAKQQLAAIQAQHPTEEMLHSLKDVIGAGHPQPSLMERSRQAIRDLRARRGDLNV